MEVRGSATNDHPHFPYFWAALIFFCSRAVVTLGLLFAQKYMPIDANTWSAGPSWYHQLLQWDSEWYFKIVTDGYRYSGDPTVPQNVVFYPLYPMLARGVAAISGMSAPHALLLIANVSGFCATLLLFKLVREEFRDDVGLATVALLSFFPTSVLLSAGYTESLELLLIISFFLVLKQQHFLAAALLAALAVADRSTGILLTPVLVWEMWLNRDQKALFPAVIPCVFIATSGLWLFMIYLWYDFGNPMAFSEGQAAFHRGTTLETRLISALKLEPFNRLILNDWNPWGLDSWFSLLFIVAIFTGFFWLRSSWSLFAAAVFMLPYLTLSGGPAGFVSMNRFNLVSFPLFVVGAVVALRVRWLLIGTIGILSAALFMNTALFARRIWIG